MHSRRRTKISSRLSKISSLIGPVLNWAVHSRIRVRSIASFETVRVWSWSTILAETVIGSGGSGTGIGEHHSEENKESGFHFRVVVVIKCLNE